MRLQRNGDSVKRSYRSPRRDQQAEETRRAILDSARELFLAGGYAGTSIKSIAERASVSEQTVYNAFGDKASLIIAVGDRIVARNESQVPVLESDFGVRLRAEPDVRARIGMVARLSRETWEDGMIDFETMVLDASATDPRLQELARHAKEAKHRDYTRFSEILFPEGTLRPGVDFDDVVDLMLAIDSAAVVRTLIDERGWTYDEYERWLVEIMQRLFLTPED